MRVLAQKQRAIDSVRAAVIADRLGDGQNVRLGESMVERRAPVPAGAEGHALPRIARIGPVIVICPFERRDIDQDARRRQLTRQGMNRHFRSSSRPGSQSSVHRVTPGDVSVQRRRTRLQGSPEKTGHCKSRTN